ncbi:MULTISPECIES: response regulator transcription factor [unclassified Anoxybacillus]|uniref:response regulator transcription factor n=1 Tax=Anoxybacillus sp. LAT_11 TaxID=2862718 RepID=UPI0023B17384|nr:MULTISPECIES: helix-turn-helix transcriptional regulator [unclassified Anoxybacillus]
MFPHVYDLLDDVEASDFPLLYPYTYILKQLVDFVDKLSDKKLHLPIAFFLHRKEIFSLNYMHLLKTTISCYERYMNQPIVLLIDEEIIFSYDSSDDIKYFFYKNESYLKQHTANISRPTLLQYGLLSWLVFPVQTTINDRLALIFISYPYHDDENYFITCLIETIILIIQEKYREQFLTLEIEQLSERERQVFFLLLKGYSNKEIAEELILSEHTIKNHINNIFQKLDVKRRSHLIAKFKHLL